MENKQTFGAFIIQRRKRLNMSQRDLAKRLYITESAVSKWERGITYPDITLLSVLCQILDVSEGELIHASENPLQRRMEKDSNKLHNIKRIYLYILYTLFGGGVITSFIVNLAINNTLSWFYIVLVSTALASTIFIIPVIAKNHKGIISRSTFYVILIIFLIVIRLYIGHGDWLFITIISLTFGLSLVYTPSLLKRIPRHLSISNNKAIIYFAVNSILLILTLIITIRVSGGDIGFAMLITIIPLVLAWVFMALWAYSSLSLALKISVTAFILALFQFLYPGYLNLLIDGKFQIDSFRLMNWSSNYVSGNINIVITLSFILTTIICILLEIFKPTKY